MKHVKKINEYMNEGIFDIFKKRKKEIVKEDPIDYNPKKIGYDHPDFEKEFNNFAKDPEARIEKAFKTLHAAEKKMIPLINEMEVDLYEIREMFAQQDMVKGNGANAKYILEIDRFLKQLEDVDFKVRKGIW
tara:strand:- start:28605 stop:29000 length:396 start_codon:yes stop_codon:yes gene_type:complete